MECEQKIRFYQESVINLEQTLEAAHADLLEAKQLLERAQTNGKSASSVPQSTGTSHVIKESKKAVSATTNLPTIFMITPTYARWTQKADLTRLCQTLMHVQNLHWIVVEDSEHKTALVTNFLHDCSVESTQLSARTVEKLRLEVGKLYMNCVDVLRQQRGRFKNVRRGGALMSVKCGCF